MRNLFREKQNISISETTLVDTEPVEIVQDKINFLKFANPVQLEDIYNKTKETFKFRQNHRDKVAEIYPRFIDTDGLVSFYLLFSHILHIKRNYVYSVLYGVLYKLCSYINFLSLDIVGIYTYVSKCRRIYCHFFQLPTHNKSCLPENCNKS